jgi:hypothetical protein
VSKPKDMPASDTVKTRNPRSIPKIPDAQIKGDDGQYLVSTIRYPAYLDDAFRKWLDANPGHTKTSMIMNGLHAIGLEIPDELRLPQRKRRS